MTLTTDTSNLLDRARALTPLIEAEAERSEVLGTMAPAIIDAVADSGLFGILVPAELGGLEADLVTSLAVFEELAYADGSTGWSTMANATTSCFAAIYTGDEAVATMFGAGSSVHAGMLGPMGEATPVDGGFLVSGRYQFGSGSGHADWIGAGVMETVDGEPAVSELGLPAMRVMFLRREQAEFLGNWDVMGLAGTGSYDYVVDQVEVPEAFSFLLLEASPRRGGPIFNVGLFALTAVIAGQPFFVQTSHPTAIDYIYFSFVTMTTVGYGDYTSALNVGRMLAVLEAIFGQLYLITVVSLVVQNLSTKRQRQRGD